MSVFRAFLSFQRAVAAPCISCLVVSTASAGLNGTFSNSADEKCTTRRFSCTPVPGNTCRSSHTVAVVLVAISLSEIVPVAETAAVLLHARLSF